MPADLPDLRHDWRPVLPFSQRIWQCECCRALARDVPPDTLCRVRVAAALTAAEAAGYERATADASAYLRALPNSHQHDGVVTTPRYSTASARALNDAADAIESGAHRGAAGGLHDS